MPFCSLSSCVQKERTSEKGNERRDVPNAEQEASLDRSAVAAKAGGEIMKNAPRDESPSHMRHSQNKRSTVDATIHCVLR